MDAAALQLSPPHSHADWSPRAARYALVIILTAAGAIRVGTALLMPVISRDGVMYCWQARDLGLRSVELLATREYEQHPLFAAAILGVQRIARVFGMEDSALTWQRSAQFLTLVSGLAVVALTYVLTLRLVDSLRMTFPRHQSALAAAAIAALLPLNVWLSADVMSEQLFLVPFLGALLVGCGALGTTAACGAGLLSGVAFLARPEGVVPLLAICVAALRGQSTARRRALCVAQLVLSFSVAAGPYVALSGRFSPKFAKEVVSARDQEADTAPHLAALVREPVPWFAALPRAALETLRAGRVVMPLLALIGLWSLRRELGAGAPSLLLLTAAGQFMLGALLVWRHGYLDPRHLITVVTLLIPFAAVAPFAAFPTRPREQSAQHAARDAKLGLLVRTIMHLSVMAVFIAYLSRIPNMKDAHLRDAANWLRLQETARPEALLLGGSSERRIAFYAEMRFQPWPENLHDDADRTRAFLDHVGHFRPRVAAFEIANDASQAELRGNAVLLDALRRAPDLSQFVIEERSFTASSGRVLHLLVLDFASARADN